MVLTLRKSFVWRILDPCLQQEVVNQSAQSAQSAPGLESAYRIVTGTRVIMKAREEMNQREASWERTEML